MKRQASAWPLWPGLYQGGRRAALVICLSILIAVGLFPAAGTAAIPPAGRGYEVVTPVHKNLPGATTANLTKGVRVLPSGEGVFFWQNPPLPGAQQGLFNDYRSLRGSAGWTTEAMLPGLSTDSPNSGLESWIDSPGMSNDGSRVLYDTPVTLDPADLDKEGSDLYLRNPDGSFTFVSKGEINQTDPFAPSVPNRVLLADEGHVVVFSSPVPLLSADLGRTGAEGLYEWHDGQLTLVGTDANGDLISPGSVELGSQGPQLGPHPVSADGTRIFFTVEGHVYVRDHVQVRTIAPNGTPEGAAAIFEGASPDGIHAFFSTEEALTPDDTDQAMDLYEYNLSTDAVTLISIDGADELVSAHPSGVRVSDDGSVVYFQGRDSSQEVGLYVWANGLAHYIAPASDLDKGPICTSDHFEPWSADATGAHLVVASTVQLTPDDHDENLDVFEYTLSTGEIRRLSQGPTGGNGPVDATLGPLPGDCANQPPASIPRVISQDGRFVAFDTTEGLVSRDTNGQYDVYLSDLATGMTELVSSGTGSYSSGFVGMGRSGQDVFFWTYDALAPQDEDSLKDIYDARIGGGFPLPPSALACTGDACQGQPSLAPAFAQPGSLWLAGRHSKASTRAARARKLHRALKRCGKFKKRSRRRHCKARAIARYGPRGNATKSRGGK